MNRCVKGREFVGRCAIRKIDFAVNMFLGPVHIVVKLAVGFLCDILTVPNQCQQDKIQNSTTNTLNARVPGGRRLSVCRLSASACGHNRSAPYSVLAHTAETGQLPSGVEFRASSICLAFFGDVDRPPKG